MTRWAYQTFFLKSAEWKKFDEWANRWGEQGWEIFAFGERININAYDWGRDVFMKRPSGPADPSSGRI